MLNNSIHRPPLDGFNHLAIEVNDLEEAIHFYCEILGLVPLTMPPQVKESGIFWLKLDAKHALHLVENRESTAAQTAHFALTVADVVKWRDYMQNAGIETTPPKVEVYNAERFFIRDPSGNRIELVKWLDK
jgi:catechol 2,3-dioxygenase-like lactoylglutathione lyase family enzyme